MNPQRWMKMFLFVMAASAVLLTFRVALLQVSPWAQQDNHSLEVQYHVIRNYNSGRADIVDRNGNEIAVSVVSRHLFVDCEFLFSQFLSQKKDKNKKR